MSILKNSDVIPTAHCGLMNLMDLVLSRFYNKDAHSPRTKRLFARMKYTLETCNGRLKNFKVVHESCCHGQGTSDTLKKIKVAFEAAAVLVQYDIENRPSLLKYKWCFVTFI
eukprot:CCRYP_007775-RA/>CCRYP_007775-RA protein AED:0.40 eAED:0.58 QI:0/0/0/1/0/0/2/0/111